MTLFDGMYVYTFVVLTSQSGKYCVFPFIHEDTGITHYTCTDRGGFLNISWCGVESTVNDQDDSTDDWGYCGMSTILLSYD